MSQPPSPEHDPYEPVVVMSWKISREEHRGEGVWLLETEGSTLSGHTFTARKHYEKIEDVLEFIRGMASP